MQVIAHVGESLRVGICELRALVKGEACDLLLQRQRLIGLRQAYDDDFVPFTLVRGLEREPLELVSFLILRRREIRAGSSALPRHVVEHIKEHLAVNGAIHARVFYLK